MYWHPALSAALEEAAINTPEHSQPTPPLQEPTFFILLSLAAGPRHGYAMMKDIAYLSDNRVQLSTSTLYTALRRLLEQDWITREDEPMAGKNGRERKFYRLTACGHQALAAEVTRLESMVYAARGRQLGEST